MRCTWLADVLRAAGLKVIECDGWQNRGKPFGDGTALRGIVGHHTASSAGSGNAPSLYTCINGRPDLAGPLCQMLLARDGTYYVIASGIANHAGDGSYPGWPSSANSNSLAIEAENNGLGTETWSVALMDAYAAGSAAVLERMGRAPADWIGHFEWADGGRKIDPRGEWADGSTTAEDWWSGHYDVNERTADTFRARIEDAMGMTPAQEQKLDKVLKLLDDYFGIDENGKAKDIRLKIDSTYIEVADEDNASTLGGRLVQVQHAVNRGQ